jgi:preprotein translocase subunit SecD
MIKRLINVILAVFIFFTVSCTHSIKEVLEKPDFGIYKVLQKPDIPVSFTGTLEKSNIITVNDSSVPFLGYIKAAEFSLTETDLPQTKVKLLRTYYPVDENKTYYGIAAVYPNPVITGQDVRNTVSSGNAVEIRFTMEGAKKWADMTAQNTGGYVAFVVNGEIRTIPMVISEIRSGVAVINNLENEDEAAELSDLLNGM